MSRERRDDPGYVHRVRDDAQRYIQGIQGENEKLRNLVANLQDETSRLEGHLGLLRSEVARREASEHRLREQLSDIEGRQRRFSDEYLGVQEELNNLAALYVASYQLHGTLDRQAVVQVIQEIVSGLIGSEEMAIFEADTDGHGLSLVASTGIEAEIYRFVPLGQGPIGQAALTGERYVSQQEARSNGGGAHGHLTACIPLKLSGRVTGAIALFRMLPQKAAGLQPLDYELFDLLATHAATALYCTRLAAAAEVGARAAR
jgi:hypothetical protein